MTPEQALTELRRIRYDRRPSFRDIARFAGVSHMTIYRAIDSGRINPELAKRIGVALHQVTQSGADYDERGSHL